MELARPRLRADATWLVALAGLAALALLSTFLEPQVLLYAVVGAFGAAFLIARPHLGVAVILALILIEYRAQVTDPIFAFLPAGAGLLTINNLTGILLGVLLVYRIYVEHEWSFLRSRQVQLILLITAAFLFSGLLTSIDYAELEEMGLRQKGASPARFILSRALFMIYFVAFVRRPRDLRLMVGIFLILALGSALGGIGGFVGGVEYRGEPAEYAAAGGFRAGGYAVLIKVARNPNRLALTCVLALIFIWEYGQSTWQRWQRLIAMITVALLALTVFFTASRGSVVSLIATALFMIWGRDQGTRRIAYACLLVLVVGTLLAEFLPGITAERLTAIPGVSDVAGQEGVGSVYRRQYGWQIAADVCASHPVFGVGLDNYPFARFQVDPTQSTAPPHNSYILTLAEGGILALALYLALFWITLKQLRAIEADPLAMQRAREDGLDWLVRGTRCALVSYLFFSVFGDIWTLVFFYLLMAAAAVLIRAYGSPGLGAHAPEHY